MKTRQHTLTAAILIASIAPAMTQTFQMIPPDSSDIADALGISIVKTVFSFEKPTFMKVIAVSEGQTSEYPLNKAYSEINLKITATPVPLPVGGQKPEKLIVNATLNAKEGRQFSSASINPTLTIPDRISSTSRQAGPTFDPNNPKNTSIPLNKNFLLYEYSISYKSGDGETKDEKLSVYVYASEDAFAK